MNENFIKKSGLVISKLARDMLINDIGNKLPSISEYAGKLSVSRGVIQQGINFLEENNCILLQKSHGTGTFLQHKDSNKLCENTGWDLLTINMPVPATHYLQSLTTALYQYNTIFPFPLAMVYVTGAHNRLKYLEKKIYDTIVVSASSAKAYCEMYDFLDEPIVLENCQYAGGFCVYFANSNNTQIKDGMRVAYDPSSTDHYSLTKALCAGKNVEWVETPFILLSEVLHQKKVDVLIHRREYPMLRFEHLNPQPIEIYRFSNLETKTPVLLFHKENYGVRALFEKYLNTTDIYLTQKNIMEGRESPRFF
ncbi:hypothetical protein LGK97_08710 [Clostridium sp. CS001]|uniref:YhfZ family protein n=1 Tax=Clostridium sp. CS001 TaxID=2880648 RepID=UPI001CF22378|nr:YhfZ family protein [Clostridium sp. CS001]MCB2289844.1 hypothetical protein [Clostridium sp. CS001]